MKFCLDRNQLISLRKKIERKVADHEQAKKQVHVDKKNLRQARGELAALVESNRLIQDLAKEVEQNVHGQIAEVVTRCLQAVFGEEYGFQIAFVSKRGKTEARAFPTHLGHELDPESECAGGVLDTASFALRLACLMLSQPARRRVLLLDEPFRHASKEFRPAIAALMETLSREMGIQIIFVTHSEEIAVGKIIKMS